MPDEPLSETSGAARKRRARKQKKLDDLAGKDDGSWAAAFKKLGKPDLASPETGLSWVRRAQLLVAYQMATTPFPSASQREMWKRFGEVSKAIGMTHARSALEDTVSSLKKDRDARTASSTVLIERGSDIVKPATARGGATRPRIVSIEATVDVPDRDRRPD